MHGEASRRSAASSPQCPRRRVHAQWSSSRQIRSWKILIPTNRRGRTSKVKTCRKRTWRAERPSLAGQESAAAMKTDIHGCRSGSAVPTTIYAKGSTRGRAGCVRCLVPAVRRVERGRSLDVPVPLPVLECAGAEDELRNCRAPSCPVTGGSQPQREGTSHG